jgi:tetratricopeptide (TPR) repeat protein
MAGRLEALGQYDQAPHANTSMQSSSRRKTQSLARRRLAAAYVKLGKNDDAEREYEGFLRYTEGPEAVVRFDADVARQGFASALNVHERAISVSALHQLQEKARRGIYASPADFAELYIGLGEQAKAMDWLERAYAEHSSAMVELRDRRYDPVRNLPRFQAIFRNVTGPARVLAKAQ